MASENECRLPHTFSVALWALLFGTLAIVRMPQTGALQTTTWPDGVWPQPMSSHPVMRSQWLSSGNQRADGSVEATQGPEWRSIITTHTSAHRVTPRHGIMRSALRHRCCRRVRDLRRAAQ